MDWQIGQIIARHRLQQKLTQEQLGELVGVSGQTVSKWENGGVPDMLLLPAIASALHITVDALFGAEKRRRTCANRM